MPTSAARAPHPATLQVGFDFNVEIIHTYVARLLNRPRFRKIGLQSNLGFQQKLIALSNDIYHRDATVVLQARAPGPLLMAPLRHAALGGAVHAVGTASLAVPCSLHR